MKQRLGQAGVLVLLWPVWAGPVFAHDPIDRIQRGDFQGALDDGLRTEWLIAILSALGSGALALVLRRAAQEPKEKPRCEKVPWWKTALSVLAGGAAAAGVFALGHFLAPVAVPGLVVGSGLTALGVGVGLGVNKALTHKGDHLPDGNAFRWGFLQGLGFTGLAVVGMLTLPAAVTTIGAVGLATWGTYNMLQEHFGWQLFPREKGSKAYCEMTPEEQARSYGGLAGGLSGGILAGLLASYVLPRIINARASGTPAPEEPSAFPNLERGGGQTDLHAQRVADLVKADNTMKSNRSATVLEHEDGTASIGLSGGDPNRAAAAARVAERLNQLHPPEPGEPPTYRASNQPVDATGLREGGPNQPRPGNCSEPASAQAAGTHDSPPRYYQTVWTGPRDCPLPHQLPGRPTTGVGPTPAELMQPCRTCQVNAANYEVIANRGSNRAAPTPVAPLFGIRRKRDDQ